MIAFDYGTTSSTSITFTTGSDGTSGHTWWVDEFLPQTTYRPNKLNNSNKNRLPMNRKERRMLASFIRNKAYDNERFNKIPKNKTLSLESNKKR